MSLFRKRQPDLQVEITFEVRVDDYADYHRMAYGTPEEFRQTEADIDALPTTEEDA